MKQNIKKVKIGVSSYGFTRAFGGPLELFRSEIGPQHRLL